MKRKNLIIFLSLVFATLLGCSANSHGSRSNIMDSLFNSDKSSVESSESIESNDDTEIEGAPTYDNIDIDLTTMSSTMVYSQVLNMLDEPTSYVGKIVKMSGPFRPFDSNSDDYCYPAIVIQDATACCASGIEFLLYGIPRCSPKGGDGYPALEEEATIVGRFETYLEGSYMYIHLVDAIWLKNS